MQSVDPKKNLTWGASAPQHFGLRKAMLVAASGLPVVCTSYSTTDPYPSFSVEQVLHEVLQSVKSAMLFSRDFCWVSACHNHPFPE
jgi:hypothetical protein